MLDGSLPGKHCKNRRTEWWLTGALLFMGIWMIIFPRSVADSKFQFMLDIVGHNSLMFACLLTGWAHGLALMMNGHWPVWGVRLRACAAFVGALIFLHMGISLILAQMSLGLSPPPSLPIYIILVSAEIDSTYRAMADARFRH